MSDTIKSTTDIKPPTPPVVILDWEKAAQHIHDVTKVALTNVGKENHNPYIWLNDNVGPLQEKYKDESLRDATLHASIMALPTSPDTRIDKNIPDKPVTNVPVEFLPKK